jgi:rare lipoprotein A
MCQPTETIAAERQQIGRMRARAGMLALTLGLSASLIASPTMKREIAAAAGGSQPGKTAARHHWFQIGKASWYGGKFNGRKTASGETYDMYGLTCAHRTLPLGSWVRVTNLINKKWAFVRVNDRGPMVASHIVDLSYGAAQRLGVSGLAKVKIEPVNPADAKQAEALVAQLSLSDDPVHVAPEEGDPELGMLPAAR